MKFKKTAKRGASFFLALVMCVSLLQVPAYALDDAEGTADSPDVNVTVVPVNDTAAVSDTTTTAPEVTTPESTAPEAAASEDNGEFDLSKTERPEQTDDISVAPGAPEDNNTPETPDESENPDEPENPVEPENPSEPEAPVTPENPSEPVTPAEPENPGEGEEPGNTEDSGNTEVVEPQDKNWSVFYDAEEGIYKLTFNIAENAVGNQIVDLTNALNLLNQYVTAGKQELAQKEKELLDSLLSKKPTDADYGEKPIAPQMPDDMPDMPVEPKEPQEPGKPEGLDEKTSAAFDAFAEMAAQNPADSTVDNAKKYLAEQGLDGDDAYYDQYAEYMMNSAVLKQIKKDYDSGELNNYIQPGLRGQDLDNILYYGFGMYVQWTGGRPNIGDPYFEAPVYQVDQNTPEYKQYLEDVAKYPDALEEYTKKLKEYEDSLSSEDYLKYQDAVAAYNKALSDYEANKKALEDKYAEDSAVYQAELKVLRDKFTNQLNANVLEPGDILKYAIYITSDSLHTYKYVDGSFTLATPDWSDAEKNGQGVTGFDGQVLPSEGGYVNRAETLAINGGFKPLKELFESAGFTFEHIQASNNLNKLFDIDFDFYRDETKQATLLGALGCTSANDPDLANAVTNYVLNYYSTEEVTYTSLDELFKKCPAAIADLKHSDNQGTGRVWSFGGQKLEYSTPSNFIYNNFYQSILSFVYGEADKINEVLGDKKGVHSDQSFGYENDSWTSENFKEHALAYYMAHKEAWDEANALFNELLGKGISVESAKAAAFQMAVNIDGHIANNEYQLTKWGWYNSIELERMDIDFSLKKTDSETNETITSSETEFSVYYIDKITQEDGSVLDVNMYCTYDEESGSYTFVTTPSTVWTKNGELNIDYAMMKDIVYYLQEMTAPEGYDRDTNVYIVMDEETYNGMTDEAKAQLGEFDKFLDMTKSEDGLTVNVQFVNSKTPTTPDEPDNPDGPDEPDDPTPPSTPDRPSRPTTPPTTEIPEPDVPLAPGPEPEEPPVIIEEPDVPLAELPPEVEIPEVEIPEPEVPLAGQPPVTTTIPEPEVPLSDVPMTGDASGLWYAVLGLAACGLVVLNLRKKEEL